MPHSAHAACSRRLTAAGLVVAPVLLAMAVPASAAVAVEVRPAPQGCGVVVAITGVEGVRTAVVRATVPGSGDPVPVVGPAADQTAAAPEATASPAPEPVLSAERTGTGDGEVVVALDAAAVPDGDPRVAVDVTVNGSASPTVELTLPGCVGPVTGTPTPAATTEPTATPTTVPTAASTTGSTTVPTAESTTESTTAPTTGSTPAPEATGESPVPSAPASPSSSTTSPTPSATPAETTTASTTPTSTTAPATSSPTGPAPASPVSTGGPVDTSTPTPAGPPALDGTPTLDGALGQAYGAFVGTGTSGPWSLVSFTAAPQLDTAAVELPVPPPVIAAPEGAPAGVLAAQGTSTPLEALLPSPSVDDGDGTVTAQLAAPHLAGETAADPLVDLAPAAFALSASLGGLLMAGRRRTS